MLRFRIYFEDDKGVTQTAETIEKFVKTNDDRTITDILISRMKLNSLALEITEKSGANHIFKNFDFSSKVKPYKYFIRFKDVSLDTDIGDIRFEIIILMDITDFKIKKLK